MLLIGTNHLTEIHYKWPKITKPTRLMLKLKHWSLPMEGHWFYASPCNAHTNCPDMAIFVMPWLVNVGRTMSSGILMDGYFLITRESPANQIRLRRPLTNAIKYLIRLKCQHRETPVTHIPWRAFFVGKTPVSKFSRLTAVGCLSATLSIKESGARYFSKYFVNQTPEAFIS